MSTSTGGKPLPGGAAITRRYATFAAELPMIAEAFHLDVAELTFSNYVNFASGWLRRDLVRASDPTA